MADRPTPPATDRLLRRTRRRLFVTTLALLALLVVGMVVATVVVGLRALDDDVDRALAGSVGRATASLEGELPSPSEEGEGERDDVRPADSDTFVLVVDPVGQVVSNPSRVALAGLPDGAALAAAAASGKDLRTVTAGGVSIRLLTVPLVEDGQRSGYVQGGFVLALHDRQSASLVATIAAVGLAGLAAAALVTLVVTGRALRPIRETFEAQRRFVADASHELRTPAALIRANAEVMQREDLVVGDGRILLEDVIGEADRLSGLVGDLLALAAWDETRLVLRPSEVDVGALVSDTVRGASAFAAERRVELGATIAAGEPAVTLADRDRLVQLTLILLDNAVDHSPAGGRVTVTVAHDDRTVRLEVEDEGPGIPPGDLERIFEPFARVPGTTRHGSGGTGLGLAIARRIVEAHGGTIVASSPVSPGGTGGARFTVRLPIRSAADHERTHTEATG